ncbi:hypothetical protein [Amycolatopsis sp. YIM 10]|uniref:hypothetical protein n=1 Tax=Amycolatopsis sp. YIM 10 TaxID=2653857 RepID=UPI0012A8D459|nr:hypothetical protein [Amycolatopsis sp. YIM 10]QFU90402.1 hypothetical protein YIM_26140 [Amycolatopsis sp. YIM 10]
MAAPRHHRLRPRPPAPAGEPGTGRAARVLASVAANVTLLTALLYFYGLLRTQEFFAYFRVHYTLLGQTADEIFGRGVNGLLLPIAGAAGAGFLVLGLIRTLRHRLSAPRWQWLLRVTTPVAGGCGFVLIGLTAPVAIEPALFSGFAGLPGLGLALGVVLLAVAWHRLGASTGHRRSRMSVAEWVSAYTLVAFGLFWAVSDYARATSLRAAYETAVALPTQPAATLYSAQSLNLAADGVREDLCAQPDSAYKFRYTGLKLLLQSGGQYVFLPADWRRSRGTAFVVPRSDKLRLDFAPPKAVPAPAC